MFNLNNVYTCLHLGEKTLSILVVEYKSGIPLFLHGQVEELKSDSNWKQKFEKLITDAETKLGLKFSKVLISISNDLVSEIKSKQVRLEDILFTNASEIVKKAHERLKKYFHQTFGSKYLYNDAQLVEVIDSHGQVSGLEQIQPDTYISLTWKILYSSCQYAEEMIKRLNKLGIECFGISLASENFPALVENKEGGDKIIVYLGRNNSEIFVVHNHSIIERKNLDYCTENMMAYIKNECGSQHLDFDEMNIYKMISQSILIYTQGIFGTKFFCEINDQFLSFNFVGTTDIYELCQKYVTRAINSVNTFVSDFRTNKQMKTVYAYFIFADEFYRHLLPNVVSQYQFKGVVYHLLNFDLTLSNDQRFIFPFAAIINLLRKQKMMNEYDYSIDPYFNEEYDVVAAKKNRRLILGKKVNALLQKLAK